MGMRKAEGKAKEPRTLSLFLRLYIYGLHGFFIEVTFTAISDFLVTRSWKLPGCSSIWSLGIYGLCGLMLEESGYLLRRKGVPTWLRCLFYLLMIYAWEFSCGAVLSYFGACPWDYTEFRFNIGGLITLEYAPFWLMAGLVTERMLIGRLEQLQWSTGQDLEPRDTGNGAQAPALPPKKTYRKLTTE